jgi:hypothetical protein
VILLFDEGSFAELGERSDFIDGVLVEGGFRLEIDKRSA